MSGQGWEREKAWLGVTAMWRGERKEAGREGIERSLCLSPVPGDCENLLTGIMLKWVGGEREKTVL